MYIKLKLLIKLFCIFISAFIISMQVPSPLFPLKINVSWYIIKLDFWPWAPCWKMVPAHIVCTDGLRDNHTSATAVVRIVMWVSTVVWFTGSSNESSLPPPPSIRILLCCKNTLLAGMFLIVFASVVCDWSTDLTESLHLRLTYSCIITREILWICAHKPSLILKAYNSLNSSAVTFYADSDSLPTCNRPTLAFALRL